MKTSGTLNYVIKSEELDFHLDEDYTPQQKVILTNLKEAYGFSKKLILHAFKECHNPNLEEAVQEWCNQHADEYISDTESNHNPKRDSSGDEDETTNKLHPPGLSMEISPNPEQELKVQFEKEVTKEQMPVDKNHPLVKDFLLAGYPLEQCIDAVKVYPDNIEKAMDYLESEDRNSLFKDNGMPLEIEGQSPQRCVELLLYLSL